ncbi:bifunctional phosphoribosylaminoimidazolecarboxamide formyltransferase/IMP cyclohydrolase [Cyclobacterium marinum]|uniref:Bifunctional purine biosynthesis protein PurH n=1 Tax=Cyclobacterium marinum (strain ATCC 25205 / DSM 745 / LMG 13164 / NCIMB 1802) TaxID=880070 RepID=G0J6V6_CYCMS|nr:bifunctional phosphoribosylaminoimidazolecarboxamide formyltransferase/IMP cyclohydrolase [Cyclobacterium marinum]AEL26154.1 phosphoribosylaminoimidazolecarboxamide formyltransferase/IMP cyclohydrolase [Cyclobacterium marinum DSM 745]MBI0399511.1 bifunctional phosphoribosylaminoimidazolecarboxamide formyltransferase/IMP cyclohydrolase [Cyclobacterium marinum]
MAEKKIQSALISVYYKDNLEPIIEQLKNQGVTIYSTGGTQKFIEDQGADVIPVEELTGYPSIFGGRVKTLHPKVFGGILHRRDNEGDIGQAGEYGIPAIDLVIVDLYPFEETVASGASEAEIIEKIDIGGIALIRAAAKNFKDVTIIASKAQYGELEEKLKNQDGALSLADRKYFAAQAFKVSSNYDTHIFNYFNQEENIPALKISEESAKDLRYGENPHQEARFYGDINALFDQLNGKELSFNNLVDVDAAVSLIAEFQEETAFAILKHTNACGVALGESVKEAYDKAFAADTISAFGGVLITNKTVDLAAAEAMHGLFFEVLIAPDFDQDALDLLKGKKNRILLKQKMNITGTKQVKTLLNGFVEQDKDLKTETKDQFKVVTKISPTEAEKDALVFALKICKHTKSNTIILSNHDQLFSSGVGQTSRVDALKQAIEKAKAFGFDLKGAVMASDAFFPFPDCVEIAGNEGISAVVQPGGSIKDKDSIAYCDAHGMSMVMTGVRHFKH